MYRSGAKITHIASFSGIELIKQSKWLPHTLFPLGGVSVTVKGGLFLKGIVEERAVDLGEYIVENKTTVRAAAKKFGISKSTVHMDVSQRLQRLNPQLYDEVREVLEINKAQRHIRGGLATKEKYKAILK